MTVNEAITRAQALKPDTYGDPEMASWLSELDGKISLDFLKQETAVSYTLPKDGDTALVVPAPYDNLYPLYLVSMVDFHNRQTEAYQNDMQMFNAAYAEYRCWYRRNNRPADTGGWKTM